jgi:hypothetical protein
MKERFLDANLGKRPVQQRGPAVARARRHAPVPVAIKHAHAPSLVLELLYGKLPNKAAELTVRFVRHDHGPVVQADVRRWHVPGGRKLAAAPGTPPCQAHGPRSTVMVIQHAQILRLFDALDVQGGRGLGLLGRGRRELVRRRRAVRNGDPLLPRHGPRITNRHIPRRARVLGQQKVLEQRATLEPAVDEHVRSHRRHRVPASAHDVLLSVRIHLSDPHARRRI